MKTEITKSEPQTVMQENSSLGLVIKKKSSYYHVNVDGDTFLCSPPKPDDKTNAVTMVAVGDRVRVQTTRQQTGRITEILPRRNALSRPSPKPRMYTYAQVIAANLDQVVPVFSTASPIPKWGLLDRYLAAAEAAEIKALICITKCDLTPDEADLEKTLDLYRRIGYPVMTVSGQCGEGIPDLVEALQGQFSALVGKSGVGKTSLLNTLEPALGLPVRPVTKGRKGKGRHTTTHLEMYPMSFGGAVMDTPGIREFGLWDIYPDELASCFPEMAPLVGQCKFGLDCVHDQEPGCAVRQAVMTGQISPLRYKSYMRLLEELL